MMAFWVAVYLFMLASFVGLGVIRRVSGLLRTPLVSITDAMSALAVIGSILVAGGDDPSQIRTLGAIAICASMTNIVSGVLLAKRVPKLLKRSAYMRFHMTASVAAVLMLVGNTLAGQQPPLINGVIGTIALEGTVDKTSLAPDTIAVETADGVRHLLHFTTRTVVHGGKAASQDALGGLEHGSRVVVHYTAEGDAKTAHEVDRVAKDGVKEMTGTAAYRPFG